jgi:hypothetical protein
VVDTGQDATLRRVTPKERNKSKQSATGPSVEVEMERLQLDREDRYHKYRLWASALQGARIALWIVSTWVPLQVVERMAGDISGKQTHFDV